VALAVRGWATNARAPARPLPRCAPSISPSPPPTGTAARRRRSAMQPAACAGPAAAAAPGAFVGVCA
jgi:hypothetical protein